MSCVRGILAYFKGQKDGKDYFSNLPTEILQIIFAHLRPKCLFENVLPVCRRFYSHWDDIWREEDAWSNWDQQKRHVTSSNHGYIEAVKLFTKSSNGFCISASRKCVDSTDRSLKVWSLGNRKHNDGLLYETTFGHSETVSGIVMQGADQFISRAYHCLKLWNIDNSAVREISIHQVEPGNLIGSMAYEERKGILACSNPFEIISLLDAHNGLQEIGRFARPEHEVTRPLLAIEIKGTHVYLAFTDQLATVDLRRLDRPVQEHTFDRVLAPDRNVDIRLNWSDELLQCYNHRGYVQEFEVSILRHRYSFTFCNEKERVWNYPTMQLVRNKGALIATTGTVIRAFSLRPRHEHIGTFTQFPGAQYPTTMDAQDGNVVVGCSGGSLITWTTDDEN